MAGLMQIVAKHLKTRRLQQKTLSLLSVTDFTRWRPIAMRRSCRQGTGYRSSPAQSGKMRGYDEMKGRRAC